MKSILFFLSALFTCINVIAFAQPYWESQFTGLPSGIQTIYFVFDAVSDNVCWAVNRADNTSANQYIRTVNGGQQWEISTIGDAPSGWRGSYVSAIDENTAWILMHDSTGATSGGVFKTTDGGKTWTQETTAFPGTGGFPKIIHFFDSNDGICIGNPNGGYWEIYRTSNGGDLWTRVDSSKFLQLSSSEKNARYHCSVAGNCLWFGYFDDNYDSGGFYRTKDRGLNWDRRSLSGEPKYPEMKDSLNGVMVGEFPNTWYKTTDGGDSWDSHSISLQFSTWVVTNIPGTENSYVLTSTVYPGFNNFPGSAYTLDNGETWHLMDNTVSRGVYPDFATPNTGWCGSLNDSVYKYVGPALIVSVEDYKNPYQPESYTLKQNYPNPFNPSTTIKYSIPIQEFVTMKIYDVLGNEIATLVNEEKPAGSYEAEFNANDLASGIYFYRMKAGEFIKTGKMMMLK